MAMQVALCIVLHIFTARVDAAFVVVLALMDKNLRHRINVGRECVREQIPFFRKQFGRVVSEWKEDNSRVTFADFAISERIGAALQASFPEDDFCSEESDPHAPPRPLKARYCWILDPIDGTNNFALGLPLCCISLGLLKDGMPVYGFLYDFGRDRIIEGGPGLGLKDGEDSRGAMPQKAMEEKSIVGLSFPLRGEWREKLDPIVTQMHIRSISSGALSLAYTGLGIIEGCIDFRSKSWDVAAACAIMQAAGGRVEFLDETFFPLKSFDIKQKPCPFFAGTEDFCDKCRKMVRGEKS